MRARFRLLRVAGFVSGLVPGLVAWAMPCAAQTIALDHPDAEVWLPDRTVTGTASAEIDVGMLWVDLEAHEFEVSDGRFEVDVRLDAGVNEVVACGGGVCSDTVRWSLGYVSRPEVYAYAEVDGRTVTLRSDVLEAPNGPTMSYAWSADPENPAGLSLNPITDSTAAAVIPDAAPAGEYYFDLLVTDSAGREGSARTYVTVADGTVEPFDIALDHAAWIDRAIVYEVTPYIFERNGRWSDVTARLDELARLGVNTIWIQPVFDAQPEGPGTSGQGYGIVDYFRLRDDLGSEDDLRELVRAAKEDHGMRVLFDFVPSHTSILHRYAQDVLDRREESPYFDFYMTEPDAAPYSQHYNTDVEPFVYYFWRDLVIIDWDNPEVYRWMREAGQKWIEDFDIDGYRIDAVWGINARSPEAMQKWRFDLKRLKPEIFLLGESPAARALNFDARFDAAYDWYAELGWVSHWTWQTTYSATHSHTVFNSSNEWGRSSLLRRALTNKGAGYHPDAKIFRFMENNDTERFFAWHSLEQTKMAAALLFSLPGIPMIYNGQEIGARDHPYETNEIYAEGRSIRSLDRFGLYDHYQGLIALRNAVPALYGDSFHEVPITPEGSQDRAFAYRRSRDDVHVIGVLNLVEEPTEAVLEPPLGEMGIDESGSYYVTELLSGDVEQVEGSELATISREVPGYTAQLFAVSTEMLELPVGTEPPAELPARPGLAQNYPNPFNPSTTIAFELPESGRVTLRIFDVLGREISTLVDGRVAAGRHRIRFDAAGLASGVYFYRLETGDRVITRQMSLAR